LVNFEKLRSCMFQKPTIINTCYTFYVFSVSTEIFRTQTAVHNMSCLYLFSNQSTLYQALQRKEYCYKHLFWQMHCPKHSKIWRQNVSWQFWKNTFPTDNLFFFIKADKNGLDFWSRHYAFNCLQDPMLSLGDLMFWFWGILQDTSLITTDIFLKSGSTKFCWKVWANFHSSPFYLPPRFFGTSLAHT
jgi:hypothetical protein